VAHLDEIDSAPITGVHLWFDRPITPLPHAVVVGRLCQWVFYRGMTRVPGESASATGHYYQIVISASRDLSGRDPDDVVRQILVELETLWPAVGDARLVHRRIVTQRDAVFSVCPGLDQMRPSQRTPIANLMLAGDWTATGWPATMEGAVRSGYLAAEGAWAAMGRPHRAIVADLPRGIVARLVLGRG
jgi:hypothetical protein